MPLPFLITTIIVKEFKLKRLQTDNLELTTKPTHILGIHMPRMWIGYVITNPTKRPHVLSTRAPWNEWILAHSRDALIGGRKFNGKMQISFFPMLVYLFLGDEG